MGSCRPPILFLCSLPGRTVCGVLMWLRGQFGDVGQTVMGWKGRQRTIVKCSPFSGISERVVAGLKLLLPFSTINKGSSTRQTDRRVLESLTFSHWTYFRTFVLLKKELNLTPVECQAKFSALVPPTFESDLFSLILGKITVKMLFQHRTNNYNCITWRKTVQCPCPANEIGALEFVTPQWSIPEMSRMTAFLRFPRAAAWPSCSCTSASAKTAKCETVATSGLGNRLLKTRWFVDDEGLSLRTITHWLPCFVFFSLLDHGSPHTTRANRDDNPWSFCAPSRQRTEVKFSFWSSMFHHQSALLSLGIAIAVRLVTSALLWKKEREKILVVVVHVVGVHKKCSATERSFQKDLQDIVETKSPRDWKFGAKSYKSAGNKKKLFETDITLERKEIISSFERNRPLRASPKTFSSGRVPPTPATCHSPMTDISVIRPLRWSFWWRIYPSHGTQRVKTVWKFLFALRSSIFNVFLFWGLREYEN